MSRDFKIKCCGATAIVAAVSAAIFSIYAVVQPLFVAPTIACCAVAGISWALAETALVR
jgi:hypothetical protein